MKRRQIAKPTTVAKMGEGGIATPKPSCDQRIKGKDRLEEQVAVTAHHEFGALGEDHTLIWSRSRKNSD
jgi:hypothetical protein